METTQQFFYWWYEAWGIGGWVVFLVFAIIAIAWHVYDSQTRRIRATGWLLSAILTAFLLLPSFIMGFSSAARTDMQGLWEAFFYLGLIGGILPIVIAMGYYITYQDDQHASETEQVAASAVRSGVLYEQSPGHTVNRPSSPPPMASAADNIGVPNYSRPKVNAWLVEVQTNHNHQLYRGDTRLGRNKRVNDIAFADKAISREHILIREENGHFTIYDRGSKTGTYVNGNRLEGPTLLAHDDEIEIGDTHLRFMTSKR